MHQNSILRQSQQLNPECPICNHKYDIQRIQILDENEQGVLTHFSCKNCFASFLATIVETPFGHMASGLLTDLCADEVLKFAEQDTINNDDVLEIHEMLEKNQFNFNE